MYSEWLEIYDFSVKGETPSAKVNSGGFLSPR